MQAKSTYWTRCMKHLNVPHNKNALAKKELYTHTPVRQAIIIHIERNVYFSQYLLV